MGIGFRPPEGGSRYVWSSLAKGFDSQMGMIEHFNHLGMSKVYYYQTIAHHTISTHQTISLDDPEIRKIAAKYGDPDQLLREDLIPDILR